MPRERSFQIWSACLVKKLNRIRYSACCDGQFVGHTPGQKWTLPPRWWLTKCRTIKIKNKPLYSQNDHHLPAEMYVALIVIFAMATSAEERSEQDVNPLTASCFYTSSSSGTYILLVGEQWTKTIEIARAIGYGFYGDLCRRKASFPVPRFFWRATVKSIFSSSIYKAEWETKEIWYVTQGGETRRKEKKKKRKKRKRTMREMSLSRFNHISPVYNTIKE